MNTFMHTDPSSPTISSSNWSSAVEKNYLLTGVFPFEFQEKREICQKGMTSPFYIPALLSFVEKTLPGRLTAFRLNRIK